MALDPVTTTHICTEPDQWSYSFVTGGKDAPNQLQLGCRLTPVTDVPARDEGIDDQSRAGPSSSGLEFGLGKRSQKLRSRRGVRRQAGDFRAAVRTGEPEAGARSGLSKELLQ